MHQAFPIGFLGKRIREEAPTHAGTVYHRLYQCAVLINEGLARSHVDRTRSNCVRVWPGAIYSSLGFVNIKACSD